MNRGDLRSFYQILNTSCGRSPGVVPSRVRKANGEICKSYEELLDCWAEHFRVLLNHPAPPNLDDVLAGKAAGAVSTKHIDVSAPSMDEVSKALSRLKLRKAAGADDLSPELLRFGGEPVTRVMHKIIMAVWSR